MAMTTTMNDGNYDDDNNDDGDGDVNDGDDCLRRIVFCWQVPEAHYWCLIGMLISILMTQAPSRLILKLW